MRSAIRAIALLLVAVTASGFTPQFSSHQRTFSRALPLLFQTSIPEYEAMLIQRAEQNVPDIYPEVVYTLVYNPYTDQEGVHTTEYPAGSGQQALLVWESIEEANEFAFALDSEPSVPGKPVVTPTPLAQIEMAATQMGWGLKVIPETAFG